MDNSELRYNMRMDDRRRMERDLHKKTELIAQDADLQVKDISMIGFGSEPRLKKRSGESHDLVFIFCFYYPGVDLLSGPLFFMTK